MPVIAAEFSFLKFHYFRSQFGGKMSRNRRKILFKNTIWNPDHSKQIQTINRSSNSFVKPINRNTMNKNSINRNNLIKINSDTIFNTKKPINNYKPPIVYILNATTLVKPHGIESLRCDIFQLRPDIVIITSHGLNHITLMDSFLLTVTLALGKIGLRKELVVY